MFYPSLFNYLYLIPRYFVLFYGVRQFATFKAGQTLCILLGINDLLKYLFNMMRFTFPKINRAFALSPIVLASTSLFSCALLAEDNLDVIEVHGQQLNKTAHLGNVDALLKEQGVDFSAAGGMSSLPILNGMMGDRIKVLIDGADITAACANHMNPPLSYISANQVQTMSVVAGISPVSAAGDNIAGVISVNSINPQFNDNTDLVWHLGYLSGQYRSNNEGKSLGAGVSWASSTVSIEYQGAYEDAQSYHDGHGDIVLDTLYRAQNHSVTAAFRDEKQQLALKLNHQSIPFQGFPNQYMDMTDNKSVGLTSQYQRQIASGEFTAQVNWHHVTHKMGFFSEEKTGMMPMNTDAKDLSYQLQWRLELGAERTLILGHAYHDYQLDDWWPAIEGSMMMGPNDFININEGQRQRFAAFAELEQQLSAKWQLSSGIRVEYVRTQTGEVAGYSDGMNVGMGGMMDINAAAAEAFNALEREQADSLIDVSLLARYTLSANESIEVGFARKNRAPNLYERYSWGRSTMATTMIGWFGDANGYVGDPDLKPETAHTISASYLQKSDEEDWTFSANLWFTKVSDFVDAQQISHFNSGTTDATVRNILQFTNLDATLFGSKLNASYKVVDSQTWGQWRLMAQLSATHGRRDSGDGPLYQIKPLQGEIALQQQVGRWQNALAWQWVAGKSSVDKRRLENTTDSYHLLNISSQTTLGDVNLTLSVTNLLDEEYQMPLGGVSIAQYKNDSSQGFMQLAGEGRSVNFGVNYQF